MSRIFLALLLLTGAAHADGAPTVVRGLRLLSQSTGNIGSGQVGIYNLNGIAVLHKADNSVVPIGAGTVDVFTPLAGDGSSGSPLTCATCIVSSGSYSDPSWLTALAASKLSGTLALTSTFAATIGTWSSGLLAEDSQTATFHRYVPSASGLTWYWGFGEFDNSPGPRKNITTAAGFNLGPGGGRVVTGALNGAIGHAGESYYETVGGDKVMELHALYVDPGDTQHRLMSCMGNLVAPYPTSCFYYASQLSFGAGLNSGSPVSLSIDSGKTQMTSPSGLRSILLDDDVGDPSLTIKNGTLGNPGRGFLKITNDGQLGLNGKTLVRIFAGSSLSLQAEADGTVISLLSPDATNRVQVSNDFVAFYGGSNQQMTVRSGGIYAQAKLVPNADKHAARFIGASGERFSYAGVAADSEPVSCSSTADSGLFTTVVGGAGVADIFKVCMRDAGGNYAWRSVYSP